MQQNFTDISLSLNYAKERRQYYLKKVGMLFSLLFIIFLLFYASVAFGTKTYSLSYIFETLKDVNSIDYFAIHDYRLPRSICAIFVGMGFAVSGLLIQSVLNNDLASGETLGINNSAGLFSVIAILLFPAASIFALPLFAFIGGLCSFVFIWFITRKKMSVSNIVIIGVALATLYASITNFVLLSFKIEISSTLVWLTGSLWGRTWEQVYYFVPWLILVCLFSLTTFKVLDLFPLKDAKVKNLGFNVNRWRFFILLLATLISSISVSITGPIAFLGLIAPHIARRIFGHKHLFLILGAAFIGAILLQSADILARVIKPPVEFPTGVLTSVIGAPYFFYLLIKRRN
ncbi:iron chelate uptake ABC transporter family permease subunit [Psittacicella gerlachiana]|uniref:Iron complex transport system permease protein n=1 Tax=Psittacicella gerlachiana TaxID=2028574 RepID=A0A3A1Y324_9GAMM|nr:iron chelate uptake ABC transporter family permease subunit [Psittacicella gerlachiana]RIY31636.1 hypothetical protein CKF59_07495 [Psittacicella gerlachiana]